MIDEKDSSSLEDRLRAKIKQKDTIIDDKNILHAITGQVETTIGSFHVLSTELSNTDKINNIKARLGIGRDDYCVPTGIYAIGTPDNDSPVLVTANYKLTIDMLRIELAGLDIWILVIDTNGVNVWCSAGKRTFSTEEIIYRIQKYKLKKLVSHNQIILPQLSAPGISAYQITKYTGFKAVYGPVYARDIKEFLKQGCIKTEKMKKVHFNLSDRLTVSPIEFIMNLKYLAFIFIFFLILQLISGENKDFIHVAEGGFFNTIPYLIALFTGTILFPALLPILPFRMFSVKSIILGIVWSSVVIKYSSAFYFDSNIMVYTGNTLILIAAICFLSMNFTGSTTFTSLSGVKKETGLMLPLLAVFSTLGIILMIAEKIIAII